MAYTRTIWAERVSTGADRYLKGAETATHIFLTNDPESVTQAGTPFDTGNMNHIEQGIYDAHGLIAAETNERKAAVTAEANERKTAVEAETQARETAVAGLRAEVNQARQNLQMQMNELAWLVNFLRELVEAENGPAARQIPIAVAEDGDFWVTESGDFVVM
jgi:hypothetical protein